MHLWSPPRLDLDRAQQRCGCDRNQNASEAKRALHGKLIGDAEQGDVAGKRQQNAALSISTVIRRV